MVLLEEIREQSIGIRNARTFEGILYLSASVTSLHYTELFLNGFPKARRIGRFGSLIPLGFAVRIIMNKWSILMSSL